MIQALQRHKWRCTLSVLATTSGARKSDCDGGVAPAVGFGALPDEMGIIAVMGHLYCHSTRLSLFLFDRFLLLD
jgi:hypothetical protein